MEEINLGAKVQEFRNMRQYSLRELASRADLTPSMLSQIENNTANPSINTLKAIAAALEVPMFKFFQGNSVSEDLIVRKGNYVKLGSIEDGVIYDLLTPDLSGDIEMCLMEIPAQSVTSTVPKSHVGEEVAYVVSGKATIRLEEKSFDLSDGDSVRIPPGVKHLWENRHDEVATVIFAITPPSF